MLPGGIPNVSGSGASGGTAFSQSTNIIGLGGSSDLARLLQLMNAGPPANGGLIENQYFDNPITRESTTSAYMPMIVLGIAAIAVIYFVVKT